MLEDAMSGHGPRETKHGALQVAADTHPETIHAVAVNEQTLMKGKMAYNAPIANAATNIGMREAIMST